MFTHEELKNLLALVQRSNISGSEAGVVVMLTTKINNLILAGAKPKEKVEKSSAEKEPKKEPEDKK